MSSASVLIERFHTRNATVAVIGLGYVGLPTVRAFHDAGFRVIGLDTDPAKVDRLRRAEPYIRHLGQAMHDELARSDRFTPTTDPAALASADAIVLCVPTPLDEHHRPDLRYLESSARTAAAHARAPSLIASQSTSYPGTLREVIAPALAAAGHRPGVDVLLAYSPEREDPGRATHTTRTIPRLVGGLGPDDTAAATALYQAAVERVVPVASAEVAEASKLLENIYRAVNIALVNEMKIILDRMDIDIWQVVEAAATKPFGFQRFDPGPGFGGHCIPVDPFYLSHRAEQLGVAADFIALAGVVNARMPAFVVDKLEHALRDQHTPLAGARVLLLGLAYKPNIDDDRETPAAEIIKLLTRRGASVAYHDPHIPRFAPMRKHDYPLESVPLTPDALAGYDAAIVVTHHDAVDYQLLADTLPLIVDTRHAMAGTRPSRARIVRA